jgi:uncharacterized protein YjbJ (UPF0337 family)
MNCSRSLVFFIRTVQVHEGNRMDKEHVKGTTDKVKGSVKDTVGSITGNKRMQAEGKVDKAKGTARQKVGDIKEKLRGHSD